VAITRVVGVLLKRLPDAFLKDEENRGGFVVATEKLSLNGNGARKGVGEGDSCLKRKACYMPFSKGASRDVVLLFKGECCVHSDLLDGNGVSFFTE